MAELNEKCAVAGIVIHDSDAAAYIYESLFAMQHRGAEASGIVSEAPTGRINHHRKQGMVVDVYTQQDIENLAGSMAIGHNRYSTSGSKKGHPQPVVDEPIGFALSVNGNLPTTAALESYLSGQGIVTKGANDVEMMGYAIAQHIRKGLSLPEAIRQAYPLFTGAFSAVAMHQGNLVAFRDAYGIRPLALGETSNGYVVTSETCGLDILGATYMREVEPGEMVIITKDALASQTITEGEPKLDMFEMVYFARHDSRLYGQSVNEVRRRFGEQLALEHQPWPGDTANVVVVPVPDTSVPIAEGYADRLGLRHAQALIKNRYIGRTFMRPTHADRQEALRRKHNIVGEAVYDRDVVFIDDSIVRLNTMPRLVELAYAVGARSVSVLVGSAPVRFPDFYGIDTPHQHDLAAANLTIEEMRAKMSKTQPCHYLGFLSLDGMIAATGMPAHRFNLSCFTGEYPIDIGERRAEIQEPVSREKAC